MNVWRMLATVAVAAGLTAGGSAQSKLTLKVHTGKGQVGYDVNSTMLIGEREIRSFIISLKRGNDMHGRTGQTGMLSLPC